MINAAATKTAAPTATQINADEITVVETALGDAARFAQMVTARNTTRNAIKARFARPCAVKTDLKRAVNVFAHI